MKLPESGAILRSYSTRHFYRITSPTVSPSQPSNAALLASAMSHAEPQPAGFSPPCMCSRGCSYPPRIIAMLTIHKIHSQRPGLDRQISRERPQNPGRHFRRSSGATTAWRVRALRVSWYLFSHHAENDGSESVSSRSQHKLPRPRNCTELSR